MGCCWEQKEEFSSGEVEGQVEGLEDSWRREEEVELHGDEDEDTEAFDTICCVAGDGASQWDLEGRGEGIRCPQECGRGCELGVPGVESGEDDGRASHERWRWVNRDDGGRRDVRV